MTIAGASLSNIDLEHNEIRLVTRKTGKSLTIPMAEPLWTHIVSLTAGDDPAHRVTGARFAWCPARHATQVGYRGEFVNLLISVGNPTACPRSE